MSFSFQAAFSGTFSKACSTEDRALTKRVHSCPCPLQKNLPQKRVWLIVVQNITPGAALNFSIGTSKNQRDLRNLWKNPVGSPLQGSGPVLTACVAGKRDILRCHRAKCPDLPQAASFRFGTNRLPRSGGFFRSPAYFAQSTTRKQPPF